PQPPHRLTACRRSYAHRPLALLSGGTMTPSTASFADLLRSAVTDPGVVSSAYRQFHTYSIGNQLLAWGQCLARGLQPGPLATFPRWKELGRHVRRGERAIVLCQPATKKRPAEAAEGAESGPEVLVRFTYRAGWFVLAQTDGADLLPAEIPSWDAQ